MMRNKWQIKLYLIKILITKFRNSLHLQDIPHFPSLQLSFAVPNRSHELIWMTHVYLIREFYIPVSSAPSDTLLYQAIECRILWVCHCVWECVCVCVSVCVHMCAYVCLYVCEYYSDGKKRGANTFHNLISFNKSKSRSASILSTRVNRR